MAIEGIESFANVAAADLALKYRTGSVSSIQATGSRWGTPCGRMSSSAHEITMKTALAGTVGMAFAWKFGGLSGDGAICSFAEEGNAKHIALGFHSDGRLYFARGDWNGTVIANSTLTASAATWYHIEIKVVIADAGGTAQVWVNGISWISFSGDTRNGGSTGQADIAVLDCNGNTTEDYCDWVVWSSTTGPVGDCRVGPKLPSGAGTTTQMTASAGSNYQCVDEAAQNGDTDYVSEATAGELDTYAFAALGLTGTVKAVQVNVWARKDDAGSRTLAPVIRQGGTNYAGTAQSVLDGFACVDKQIYETDPNTAAAWTTSGVDSAEYGQKLVS